MVVHPAWALHLSLAGSASGRYYHRILIVEAGLAHAQALALVEFRIMTWGGPPETFPALAVLDGRSSSCDRRRRLRTEVARDLECGLVG